MKPIKDSQDQLIKLASHIRIGCMIAIFHAGSGHPGGTLSCADLMAYLWGRGLRFDKNNPEWEGRDRFILSKGHACPALYAAAAEMGIISRTELITLRKLGSPLQGHPHVKALPWVETSTGSLGQGFSVAIGMAMGLRYQQNDARVYVMLGDGELQEGEVWEGAMCASHHKLDNLCAIIDYNKMQSDDLNENIMGVEPLRAKLEAFNWNVVNIDGHDFLEIEGAFNLARECHSKPTVIIAHTIKGKGISYMEGSPLWHGSVKLSNDDIVKGLQDLGASKEEIRRYMDGTARH
ncbi:MAG: transketolase [Clostridia bacterium]|nr:transketolase [Clostridia bacterium]